MAYNMGHISNPNAPKNQQYQQQQYQQQQYQQQQYQQNQMQRQHSGNMHPHGQHSQQMSGQVADDNKNDDATKAAEAKKKLLIKNQNIHFNFYDQTQYGIVNFPKALSEIAILCCGTKNKKALIVGCGSGRLCFELCKTFTQQVDGIDLNNDFIETANLFKTKQFIGWEIVNHGDIVDKYRCAAFKDLKCDANMLSKCKFTRIASYNTIPFSYNKYDCIVIMNILDKLRLPKKFVTSIQRRLNKGGIIIFNECFNWNENITNKDKWIGGSNNNKSSDLLQQLLSKSFELIRNEPMTFIERENAFKYKLSISNTLIMKKK